MNIGIVIGVSEYQNSSTLDGCLNDAKAVKQLLDLTNKCEDTLYITENTESSSVKSKIAAFVKKYQNEQIEEVIFYFTGHGLFEDEEFYYVLSDFNSSKKKQTSLENSELDNLLRSLSASLTVKIVDACQSGTRYIKDPDAFEKYLKKSEQNFDRCYFFYSSQNDQYSYQNDAVSDFTAGLIKTFIDRPEQEVRYKDIMDSLSDEFSANTKQTPFFVMQGTYTEQFGYVTAEVADALKLSLNVGTDAGGEQEDTHKSLIQLVEEQATLYCTEDEAVTSVGNISKWFSSFHLPEIMDKLYTLEINTSSEPNINLSKEYVGKFLSECDIDYLVSIEKERRVRKVPKSGGVFLAAAFARGEDVPMVEKYYKAVVGATSTVDLPYNHIFIRSVAKYPNINDTGCIVIPYVSQTKIAIFSVFFSYRTREWDVKEINRSTTEWAVYEEYAKDDAKIKDIIDVIFEKYTAFTLNPIKESTGLIDPVDEKDS